MTKLIPRTDQEAAIRRMVDEPTWAVLDGSEPSAGKTVMHVEQGLRMNASVVVAVGPLGTVDGWAKTLLGQSDGKHELKWITSKKAGMAHYADLLAGKPGWYFIGRELFRKPRIDAAKIKADLGIVDECLVAGTLISTPSGDVPIESIRAGDMAYGFDHESETITEVPVGAIMNKQTNHVVSKWGATPNHPFYVEGHGYAPLGDVDEGDVFYGIEVGSNIPQLRKLQQGFRGSTEVSENPMLPKKLRAKVEGQGKPSPDRSPARSARPVGGDTRGQEGEVGNNEKDVGVGGDQGKSFGQYDKPEPGEAPRGYGESIADEDSAWSFLRAPKWGQRESRPVRARDVDSLGEWLDSFIRHTKRERGKGSRDTHLVQGRPGIAGVEVGSRMRRSIAQFANRSPGGHQEGFASLQQGVDYIEIQEPRDFERFGLVREESYSSDEVTVYNIETGSGNYFANGILVHNCQLYSNRKSAGWKKLMQFQPMFKVACSGTWFGNKVENMWSVARWLWPDKVDRSFWRWVDEWLDTEHDYFAGKKVTGEKVEGAFASSLPCYVRIVPTLVELETPIQRWVDLSPVQRRMYDKLEKDLFVQAASDVLMTEVSIATRTRLRQLSMAECDAETVVEEVAGEMVERQRVWFPVGARSSKFEELQEIIAENVGEPMLVLTDSAQFVDLAVHRLGAQAFAWRGGVSQEARNDAKRKFVDGEIRFIVAQVASIGEGVDGIQFGCNTVVWASKSDSNFLNKQALRRAHRTGQVKPVRQFEIMARDTIDDEQHLALLTKGLKIEAALAFDNANG